jgi:hypothetical protein
MHTIRARMPNGMWFYFKADHAVARDALREALRAAGWHVE